MATVGLGSPQANDSAFHPYYWTRGTIAAVPALNHPDVRLVLLFGAKQRKVPLDLAVSIQPLGATVSYVEVDASAPEALDFHLTYLVGRTLATDPGAGIHIVSRDKGFDPLIRYLRNTGHRAFRVDSLRFLMRVDTVKALDPASRTELAWQMLNQYDGKPRTLERLHKTLKTLFHGALPEAESADVVERLSAAGRYVRDGDEIRFTAACRPTRPSRRGSQPDRRVAAAPMAAAAAAVSRRR